VVFLGGSTDTCCSSSSEAGAGKEYLRLISDLATQFCCEFDKGMGSEKLNVRPAGLLTAVTFPLAEKFTMGAVGCGLARKLGSCLEFV